MAKLSKSLEQLDALADEMLLKSQSASDDKDGGEANEPAPEDISDDKVAGDGGEGEEKKAEGEELEKCDPNGDVNDIKKSADPEPEEKVAEEDNGEGEEEDDDDSQTPEEVEKSIKEDFEMDDTIRKGMEASDFLTAIVDVLSKGLSDVQYDVLNGHKGQESANAVMAKSLQASLAMNAALRADNEKLVRRVNKLEKSMGQGFERIMDALDGISSQPVGMRKSFASNPVQVHEKNFAKSIGQEVIPTGFEALSKSQVMSVLEAELMAQNPSVSTSDIIGYESGAPLRQDLQQLVASKFR